MPNKVDVIQKGAQRGLVSSQCEVCLLEGDSSYTFTVSRCEEAGERQTGKSRQEGGPPPPAIQHTHN